MTDKLPTEKSSIDLKDLTIKAGSGVALYWVVNKYLMKDDDYNEYLKAGIIGGVGLTVIAPILENLLNDRDLLTGIHFDSVMAKDAIINGGLTAVILYGLRKTVLTDEMIEDSLLMKYAGVIASVIGSDMLRPYVKKHFE